MQACTNNSSDSSNENDTTAMQQQVAPIDDNMANQRDTVFTTKAAISGIAEVELGKMALEKAVNAKVKAFATMMVNDHAKANEELKTLATNKGIILPNTLDGEHAGKRDKLKSKSGNDFDRAYADEMFHSHRKTLKLMEDGSKDLKDNELKGFAAKTAPIVRHHLEMIVKIKEELK